MTLDITNGKKTTELDALLTASDDDLLIIRTSTGMKKITKGNLFKDIGRRTRKDITGDLANLPAAAAEQNLEKYGYSIGDFFTGASGFVYILADMDTYYGGYTQYCLVDTHHIGIVVDTKQNKAWHATASAVVSAGYAGSDLQAYLSGAALTLIRSDFTALFGDYASHLIPHGTYMTTAFANWALQENQYIHALTEVQMYGSKIWSGNEYQQGEGDKQLELFRKYKYNAIYGQGVAIWLRSLYTATTSSASACVADNFGYARYAGVAAGLRASGLILFH